MQLKRQSDRAMESLVAAMQLPTRSDVELVIEKVSALEELVRDLNDEIDRLLEKREK
jgi:polyhydroxyalkanoate synthesis regulator phasin